MADSDMSVGRPQDWDKAVSAAYLWLLADEIKAAAEGAGVGERTLHRWVRSDWWPDACAEAEARWLNHLVAESRRTLTKAIRGGNADLAMRILERRDPQLSPKPQEHRVGIFGVLAQLPASRLERLESMSDDELAEEMKRLGGG